jgi:hypothetical protein
LIEQNKEQAGPAQRGMFSREGTRRKQTVLGETPTSSYLNPSAVSGANLLGFHTIETWQRAAIPVDKILLLPLKVRTTLRILLIQSHKF